MIRNGENKGSGIDIGTADGYTAVSIAERPELLYDIVAGKPIGTRFLVKR